MGDIFSRAAGEQRPFFFAKSARGQNLTLDTLDMKSRSLLPLRRF
jgi:hypothetical protein